MHVGRGRSRPEAAPQQASRNSNMLRFKFTGCPELCGGIVACQGWANLQSQVTTHVIGPALGLPLQDTLWLLRLYCLHVAIHAIPACAASRTILTIRALATSVAHECATAHSSFPAWGTGKGCQTIKKDQMHGVNVFASYALQ